MAEASALAATTESLDETTSLRPSPNRVNGILWLHRTGAPWRDIPERYGKHSTLTSRFYRWRRAGIWQQIWERLMQQADL